MGTKLTRHRHTGPEIVVKLATADEMAARGVLHRDIARSLGISVMTYHRWRKAREGSASLALQLVADGQRREIPNDRETTGQIRGLKLENSRLRRLVADLLLEKIALEESRQGVFASRA